MLLLENATSDPFWGNAGRIKIEIVNWPYTVGH